MVWVWRWSTQAECNGARSIDFTSCRGVWTKGDWWGDRLSCLDWCKKFTISRLWKNIMPETNCVPVNDGDWYSTTTTWFKVTTKVVFPWKKNVTDAAFKTSFLLASKASINWWWWGGGQIQNEVSNLSWRNVFDCIAVINNQMTTDVFPGQCTLAGDTVETKSSASNYIT